MFKTIDVGMRSIYTAVCAVLFALGLMANTQSAAIVSQSTYTSITQSLAVVFLLMSSAYLFKHIHLHTKGRKKSLFKAVGLSFLSLLLVAWTDVFTIFTSASI